MTDWVTLTSDITGSIHWAFDAVKRRVKKTLGIQDPIQILPYWGYGTPQQILIKGRVLKDEGVKLREQNAPLWKNLSNMYRRFETDEIPDARLSARLGPVHQDLVTNEEGFFEAELQPQPPLDGAQWHSVNLSLLEPQKDVSTEAEVMVITDARFGVISDIDDTIVHTAATDMLKMIRIVYLGNAKSRRPFDGVPDFYQALQRGQGQDSNPIFYMSSSAWNMYDVFAEFLQLNQIPKGPILLRDIELSLANWLSFDHESHKLENIEPVLHRFPQLPFILIGDSGQRDAEIYTKLVSQYPGRILGVLIRDVIPNDKQRQQELKDIAREVDSYGSHLFVFRETQEAIAHAADQGWIVP